MITTLNMIFSVTNSNCKLRYSVTTTKCQPNIICRSCHYCNYCHLPSDFSSKLQLLMTIFHHKLLTREGRILANS